MSSTRWKAISQSEFPWEQEALEFVRARMPDREPYRAWANFEFIADDGSVNEVDLLVLTPQGFFLVEIKSRPGRLTGDAGTWTWTQEGRAATIDSPLIGANRKAKKLKSLLQRQKDAKKIRLPFLEALVFCSAEGLDCQLEGNAAYSVCLRDREATQGRPERPGIIAALEKRQCPGLQDRSGTCIDRPMAKALTRAMEQAGIRESQRTRRVSDYVLDKIIAEGPGYQDWHATHASLAHVERRIRIYLLRAAASPEEKATIQRAAAREFQLLESLQHPGVLRTHGFTEHELGPAIIFEHHPKAVRLDHYLAQQASRLGPEHRLHLIRQIAEVVQYAHEKRVVHRALCPQSILVVDPDPAFPKIKVLNWQTGYRAGGTSTATRQVTATVHVDQLVEDISTGYMAPEALTAPADDDDGDGEHLDVFSLGAIAYHLFAGQPPACNALELAQKLRAEGGLQISSVVNGAGKDLQFLVQYSTHPDVTSRIDTAKDFLDYLEPVEDELTAPSDQKETIDDPTDARAGDLLPGGFRVLKRLGQGASSVGLLVEHDGGEAVLKVALDPDHNSRIRDEAQVLEKLRHPRIVEFFQTVEVGDRQAILMRALTRQLKDKKQAVETLGEWIRKEGRLHVDFLQRFGEDLLEAVNYLEEQGIPHRDIKPDNLAVANVGHGDKLHLVLFDFSLSRAPADSIHVGTRGYMDPFLPLRKHKRWDLHAERWSVAVTLYQMAAGHLPVWHDGRTEPTQVECEATIDAELFDANLREDLTDFFRKALKRDPDKRFDNAEQMLKAWREAFESVDQPALTTEHEDDAELGALLAVARRETQIPELGLSARASNALDRIDVLTVDDLLTCPLRKLQRMRGVGQKTRREITKAVGILRQHLGAGERPAVGENYGEGEPSVEEAEATGTGVDSLADCVAKVRGNKKAEEVVRPLLGLDEGLKTDWPTQAEVARHLNISRARVGQVLDKAQERWRRNPSITQLREDIVRILDANGGVMTVAEMADAVLAARGSVHDEPLRSRLARGVVRAAVEVEHAMTDVRFIVRRESSQILIATDSELANYGIRLGKQADSIAAQDPLMSPSRVVDVLRTVLAPPNTVSLSASRLVRLSAAASATAAVSSKQELYPRGMEAIRALKLSQGALLGARKLTVEQIHQRVTGRYPEAQPLPGRPMLDELLTQAGLDLQWDATSDEGLGAYLARSYERTGTQVSGTYLHRYVTQTPDTGAQLVITPEVATARQFEERLEHNLRDGGFIALTVAPKHYLPAAEILQRRFDVALFDMEMVFLRTLQATAEARKVAWDKVIEADATPDGRDWPRLLQLVRLAIPQIQQQIFDAEKHLLIIFPGMLARYDQMDLLETLRDRAGRARAAGGIPGAWLLIAADEQSQLPIMEGKVIPVIGTGQYARIPEPWLKNLHRSNSRKAPKEELTA